MWEVLRHLGGPFLCCWQRLEDKTQQYQLLHTPFFRGLLVLFHNACGANVIWGVFMLLFPLNIYIFNISSGFLKAQWGASNFLDTPSPVQFLVCVCPRAHGCPPRELFLRGSQSTMCFQKGSLLGLELPEQTGQWGPEICLSQLPRCWDYKPLHLCLLLNCYFLAVRPGQPTSPPHICFFTLKKQDVASWIKESPQRLEEIICNAPNQLQF